MSMCEKYYVKLDTSGWNEFQLSWFTYRSIVGIIKHESLGYVKPVSKEEAEEILRTKQIKLLIYPDSDSFHFEAMYDIECVYKESIEKL